MQIQSPEVPPAVPEILDFPTLSLPTMEAAAGVLDGGPRVLVAIAMNVPPALLRRFRILRPLGRGAEGDVFLARDRLRGDALTSLKVLGPAALADPAGLRWRLVVLSRIEHPNIARILDFEVSRARGPAWIAREYVDGRPLLSFSAPSWSAYARLLRGMAEALVQLHDRGTVHGDLRPANILCAGPAREPLLKLIDAGMTSPDRELGRLRKHDLRFAGAAFYTALTGRSADPRVPPQRWNASIPSWINRLILRLLVPYSPEGIGSAGLFLEEILRVLRHPSRGAAPPTFTKPPLLGREREFAAIRRNIDALDPRTKGVDVLLLTGPEGAGKTALLQEARTYARSRGVDFLDARPPAGEGLPYEPLGQILHEAADARGWTHPLCRRRAGTPAEVAGHFARVLVRATRRRPCVIALDDAGGVGPDARNALFLALGRLARSARVLAIVAAQDAEPWAKVPAAETSRLRLERLGRPALAELARLALSCPVDDGLVAKLEAMSGGVPGLFLASLELLRPKLRYRGGRLGLARGISLTPSPAGALRDLLAGLTQDEVRAAEALSAHPSFLPEAVALDVLGGPASDPVLAALVTRGLLRRSGLRTYEWCSTPVRDALYARLSPARRRRVHGGFARAVRRRMPRPSLHTNLFLAHHLARSSAPGRACSCAWRAARILEGLLRFADAADYYELALRLAHRDRPGDVLAILRALQHVCRKGGLHALGKRVSLEILRLRPTPEDFAAAATFVRAVNGSSAALSLLDDALASRSRRSPAASALLHSHRAYDLARLGRTREALRSCEAAGVYLSECRNAGAACDVLLGVGSVHLLAGHLDRSCGHFFDGLRRARQARDPLRESAFLDNISLALRGQLRLLPALTYARRSLAIKERRGLVLDGAVTRHVIGAILLDTAHYRRAKEEFLAARETFQTHGHRSRAAESAYGLGMTHLAIEEHAEALRWLEAAEREAEEAGSAGLALAARAGTAHAALNVGRVDEARARLAEPPHPGVGTEYRLAWTRSEILLALATGEPAKARRSLAGTASPGPQQTVHDLRFELLAAAADLAEGDPARAAARLDGLIAAAEPAGLKQLACEALLLQAEACLIAGRPREARFRFGRVRGLLGALPQPSFRIRADLLKSHLQSAFREKIRSALAAYREALRHGLGPLVHASALALARSYEAREDYRSALHYYQEARRHAGFKSA